MAGSDTAVRRARMHGMGDRLLCWTPRWCAEKPTLPMHVGGVGVYPRLNADRDVMPDVDTVAVLIEELVPTVRAL
jgi:hypothetical protein